MQLNFGIVIFGSQRMRIENKGFFSSKVRKSKKMAVFALSTFELEQMLENKRESRLFRRLIQNFMLNIKYF